VVTDVLPAVRSLFSAAAAGQVEVGPSLELAFRLHRYWASTNVGEGRFWLGRLLETAPEGDAWEPYATYALGYLEYWSGDGDRAAGRLRRAADLLRGVDDRYVARALVFLAGLLDDADRPAEAVATIEEAMEIVAELEPEVQMPAVMGLGSLLSERGDPAAVAPAVRAIDLCRDPSRVDQLTIALPTAAMICWQVGAAEQAQRFVDEAMPLHREARISRVVLYSAAAGLALGRGDVVAAEELASKADVDGTELGVERELPLVRCILARARLAAGDPARAAQAVASALEAGLDMAHDFPLALSLETAVVVLTELGQGTEDEQRRLLASAAALRQRGDRPAPAGLAVAAPPFPGEPDEPRIAARLALKLLGL
jgi:tetratricopeptide (TPR) repeat protein